MVAKLILAIGAVVLLSHVLIPAIKIAAERIGVPASIVAATLVAFGTSLPELVTAVVASRKGHGDLAVGNVIGADILNVLFVAGASAAVTREGLQASPDFFRILFPAMLLVLVFAAGLGAFPVSGMSRVYGDGGALDVAHHLVLPAIALAVVGAAIVARFFRTSLLETLSLEHVRTARAKGLPEWRVIGVHAFRNALVPVLPVVGLQAGYVLGGALYVETVFQWPGLGRMLVQAVQARDLPLVQGGVLVMATAYVLVNLAADLLQGALDPRIRTR